MANQSKRISELPSLSPASLDTTYVVGISGSTTYKISVNQLTSSLDTTFATDLVTAALSSSLDGKLSTSSFNQYTASFTASVNINTGSFATTGSNTFNGNQTISGSLFVSGTTEFGGDLVPKFPSGSTLGTALRPFKGIFVSSGSINIASDVIGDPNTTLSNVGGNILVSAGGMRLIGAASFIAVTGSFQYLSGSFTHIGAQFNIGDIVTTGSLQVSGSTVMIGNNTMQGNTLLSGSFGITGSTSFSELGNTSLLSFSSSLNSRIISATNEQSLGHLVTTSSFNSYTASISTGSLVTSITNLNTFTASQSTASLVYSINALNTFTASQSTASLVTRLNTIESVTSSYETKGRGIWSGSAQLPSGVVSGSIQVLGGSGVVSGSYETTGRSIISSSAQITSLGFTTTGSNTFIGNETITGSLNVSGSFYLNGAQFILTASVGVTTGSYYIPNNIRLSGSISSLQDVLTFTLPSNGIWEINYGGQSSNYRPNNGSGEEAYLCLTDSNNNILPNSTLLVAADNNSVYTAGASYRNYFITTNQQTLYKLRGFGSGYNELASDVTGILYKRLDYFASANVPYGTISSSAQITSFGFVSGSYLTSLSGAISSSSQLTSSYDTRYTLSGSVQPLPSNLISSSAQITAFGFISSSTTIPVGTISSSAQITSFGFVSGSYLTSLSGAISSSSQVIGILTSLNTYTASVSTGSLLTTASFNQYTASISTASLVNSINALNIFTASQSTGSLVSSIANLNTFTASISTASLVSSITNLNTFTSSNANTSLNTFTGSVVLTSSFNQYTASISTASLVSSINSLNTFTASQSTASLLTTASFNQYTASITTGSLVTTSSFNNYTASISTASLVSSITNLNNATSSYETQGRSIISSSAQITALRFVSSSVTASSIVSASSTTNVILFTKGDGSTLNVTVATGSATFVTSSFGTFHDTTTQSGSANTAYVMKLNSVDHQDGVILSGSGGMKVLQAGTYDIEFSAQLANSGGDDVTDIWLRKNGINVDDSNTRLTVKANTNLVAAWNWQDTANPNDVFEIMWSTTGGNMTINAYGAGTSPTRPAIPSLIATIHRIDVGGGSNMISNTQFNPFTASINQFTSSHNTWTSSLSAIGTLNVDYINAGRITSDQSVGVNNDIVFNTTIANGGIPLNTSTGVFTLTANKTYRIFAGLSFNSFSDATGGYIIYDWVDATTNTSLDTTGVSVGVGEALNRNVSEFNATSANLIYTPSTNQTIKLRVVGASGTAYIRAGIGTKATIEQINPSVALNQFSTLQVSGSLVVTGSLNAIGGGNLATTGSNTFRGTETISGSLLVSGSTTFTGSINISSGSITMLNRPAFRVYGLGGATSATTTLSGSMTIVDYNQGGWDNTTGTFTAPVAGLYQVNLVCRTNSNASTSGQIIVYKNHTGPGTGTTQVMIEWAANTTMNHAGGSTISKLAVGDTLKTIVAVGTLTFDVNDNFSVAYIG